MSSENGAIQYRISLDGISEAQLQGFFVGWPKSPTPAKHLAILKSSYSVVIAFDQDTQRVAGFINCLSDGQLCAFIPLLEVLPEFQGRGIGRELVRRMLEQLDHLYSIDIVCDDSVAPFYERLGLIKGTAMMRRNYDNC